MGEDTLGKRYSFKLISNLISFLLSFITAGIIPRSLGVENYGNFNFVTTIINQIVTLLDFRASTWFFTKLSQKQNDGVLPNFYFYYLTLVFFLSITLSTIIVITPLKNIIFPDQTNIIIFFSLMLIFLTWYADLFIRILDAKGQTVILEKQRMFNKILSTIFLFGLFYFSQLNLNTYFYLQYFLLVFLIIILYNNSNIGIQLFSFSRFLVGVRKGCFKSFIYYASPLGVYVILQFIQTVFDRWLLQKFGGSFEQGLYSFSFNLTNFCFLFITALIPLFTRELSVFIGAKDINRSAILFRRYVPLLYAITAFFCAFIFIEVREIITIFGGKEYIQASLPLRILAFYPLISAYSNLNGSVIYANGRTDIFLKIGWIFTPLSMVISLLLINKNILGVQLGATGLAIKNVFLELFSVIIILKINTKYLNLNFKKFVVHMLFSLVPFIVLAWISNFLTSILVIVSNTFFLILVSGVFYTTLVFLLVLIFPELLGINKLIIKDYLHKFRKLF
jgi:O-antigen/teichoic acid export membrane protein